MESALEDVSLAELINHFIDDRLINTHVSTIARVESYDATKQTVDVTPQLNAIYPDGNGNYVTDPLPKLSDIPVCFPRSGNFAITFPINTGDFVYLVFADRNIGHWRATGNQSDPGDLGVHTLDGAYAIPGASPDSAPLVNVDTSNMVLGDNTLSASADFVALAQKVMDNFNAFVAAVNGWTPVPNDGGAALKAALSALFITPWPAPVAAQKVKAT